MAAPTINLAGTFFAYHLGCSEKPSSATSKIGEATMTMKSFLLTCGIFCGGYICNTLFDSAVDAAQSYLHIQTTTYKTDGKGYIICSPEKPSGKPEAVTSGQITQEQAPQ